MATEMVRRPCPVPWCDWSHRPLVAIPPTVDDDAEVPPWCTPTWAVVPVAYGPPLTDAGVIAAHVATHPRAERNGRMPSRAEVGSAPARAAKPQPEEITL